MDLYSGKPFWLEKDKLVNSYPALVENIECDIAIIGGGISGALCAWYLRKTGLSVVVIDRRKIGTGSTCASSGLLTYEIDTPLCELINKVGKENAEQAFLLNMKAIDELNTIASSLTVNCEFRLTQSIYLAGSSEDIKLIKQEYDARKSAGIDVTLLNENEIYDLLGCRFPAAIVSGKGARMDTYAFTHGIFELISNLNCKVYDQTAATAFNRHKEHWKIECDTGAVITTSKLIFATGYETYNFLSQDMATLFSTYVVVSKPIDPQLIKKLDFLIWDTNHPYIYIRVTSDNRIMVGGNDEKFHSELRDSLISSKSKQLSDMFQKMFPEIPFEIDYSWAGTFAETEDGLPYIGQVEKHPDMFFALGYGGNGITFSQIAGEIISNLCVGNKHAGEKIFSFNRNLFVK
jgi:glycine/D-amino acid oxidase-like deaminating enzyme